jgi:hypothetical protein
MLQTPTYMAARPRIRSEAISATIGTQPLMRAETRSGKSWAYVNRQSAADRLRKR